MNIPLVKRTVLSNFPRVVPVLGRSGEESPPSGSAPKPRSKLPLDFRVWVLRPVVGTHTPCEQCTEKHRVGINRSVYSRYTVHDTYLWSKVQSCQTFHEWCQYSSIWICSKTTLQAAVSLQGVGCTACCRYTHTL